MLLEAGTRYNFVGGGEVRTIVTGDSGLTYTIEIRSTVLAEALRVPAFDYDPAIWCGRVTF